MELPRLSKSIRKVVKLQRDDDGAMVPTVVYKGPRGKKKTSSALRPIEKGIRRIARAQATMADSYLSRHNRSNQKNRDGWLKDLASNVVNAGDKGRKKFSKNCMRWPTLIRLN
jgi:hypothetical protein